MPAIFVSKQEVITRLKNLKIDITKAHKNQQKLADQYNKLMHDNFGFIEDGKPIDKLEMIELVQSLIASDKIK